MRVLFVALALSMLSFAAGIAGDLSIAAPPAPSVIVHLPPPLAAPANAIRAHPLPPLALSPLALPALATAARATPAVLHVRAGQRHLRLEAIVARAKLQTIQVVEAAKVDPDRAPKDASPETAQI
jgi:hypothetical protein